MRQFSLLLMILLGPSARAEGPRAAEIDRIVLSALKAWRAPGVAVGIVHEDRIVHLKGYGRKHIDGRAPVTPDTLFPLASCTKSFTTTLLAQLVDAKKLDWDDPVRKHLSEFRLSEPTANASVRLRDLITHRTGVRGHDFLWYHSPWSPREVVRRIGHVPVDEPIRSVFMYQSTMFTAAGFAAAAAGGKPWGELVKAKLFEPLGMKSSSVTTEEAKESEDRATGHRLNERGQVVPLEEWYPIEEPDPAGSVNANARDLCQWLRLHLNEGIVDGKRIVSAENLRETHTAQMAMRLQGETARLHPETNLMSYGMGWVIRDYRGMKLLSHAGAIDGFKAHFTFIPEKKWGIVLLCNLHQCRINLALSYSLIDLFFPPETKRDWNRYLIRQLEITREQEAEKLRQRLAEREPGAKHALPLASYGGEYEHPAYGKMRIEHRRGKLIWRWSTFALPLEHFHREVFSGENEVLGRIELRFALDEGKRIRSCEVGFPLEVIFKR